MFNLPYETRVGQMFQLEKVERAIRFAMIENRFVQGYNPMQREGVTYKDVLFLTPDAVDVPQFHQPIRLEDGRVVVDTRAYMREKDGGWVITNPSEPISLLYRALATRTWVNQPETRDWNRLPDFPLRVWVMLISDSITRRLGLEPLPTAQLKVVTAAYYYGLHQDDGMTWDESTRSAVGTVISRVVGLPPQFCFDLLDQMETCPQSLKDYISSVQSVVQSARLQQLNEGILLTLTGGWWYGGPNRETLGIALEYPPYWNTLVYLALANPGFRSTGLAKACKLADRQRISERYIRNYKMLVDPET